MRRDSVGCTGAREAPFRAWPPPWACTEESTGYLIPFPRDGDSGGVVAVAAVVTDVNLPVDKPRLVPLLQSSALDGVEGANPREAFLLGHLVRKGSVETQSASFLSP